MQYCITHKIQPAKDACLIIPVQRTKPLTDTALDSNTCTKISEILSKHQAPNFGDTLMLHRPSESSTPSVLLIFCDPSEKTLSDYQFTKLLQKAASTLKSNRVNTACFDLSALAVNERTLGSKISVAIQILESSFYQFNSFKTTSEPTIFLKSVSFYAKKSQEPVLQQAIQEGLAISKGVNLAKDLSNTPANHATPRMIAAAVEKTSQSDPNISYQCYNETDETISKMGAFLGVAQGSVEPPRFVVVRYTPSHMAHIPPIVLIGKGVTFDAGGISLKPAANMEEMKFDMAGAASVIGTITTAAQLKISVPVVGILPLVENLPSGSALKPGDVVHTLSGQTVEVLDTDAEGRLILADALTYSRQLNPAIVLDIATLTGAVEVALGDVVTGLMTEDEGLRQSLEKAGIHSNDPVWSLPLSEAYQKLMDSNVADMANLGPRGAGAITAACFLARFTKGLRWAHLDIAGTAYSSGRNKAATGRPVPLLVQFILDYAKHLSE